MYLEFPASDIIEVFGRYATFEAFAEMFRTDTASSMLEDATVLRSADASATVPNEAMAYSNPSTPPTATELKRMAEKIQALELALELAQRHP